MSDLINVAVDAMGGDNAPGEIIKGAVCALKANENLDLTLVGKEELVNEELVKEFVDFKTRLDKNYDQVAASKSLMRLHDYLTKQIKKNTSKVEKLLKKAKQQ